jgi:hypothetical protein
MTAQEWANIYGLEGAPKAGRFWLFVLLVLLIGVALGFYALPEGILPGTSNSAELTAAQSRIDRLEAEVSALEASTAQELMLRTTVEEYVEKTNAEVGADAAIADMSVAVIYTLREPKSQTCVDFLTFEVAGDVHTLVLSEMHGC